MVKSAKSDAPVISAPQFDLSRLPPLVADMRRRILEAAASGDIERLRSPIDRNEIRPILEPRGTHPPGLDPIELLRQRSFDGKGLETLSLLTAVFEAPYVVQKIGVFISYVWPSYVLRPILPPTFEDLRRMWRCVRFVDANKTDAQGFPLMQRGGIGADGTWHYFWGGEGN